MHRTCSLTFGLIVALGFATSTVFGEAKAKPKPGPGVMDTRQLAGDDGEIGQAYTLGQDGPVNFALLGAEYTVARLVCGEQCYAPKADQKLLLLHARPSCHGRERSALPPV